MFYQILIKTAESVHAIPYQYYSTLAAAKEALMDWARGVLALHPDKKYRETPVDGRAAEKQVLRVEIAAPGKKPAYEGIIVEHAFADEDKTGYSNRIHKIYQDAREAACAALAPGETVEIPYDKDDEDGNNISIRFEGRHGEVYADVKSVMKDADGKVTVTAVNEYDFEEKLTIYDILDEDWPYLADCILEEKNSKN